MVSFENDYVEGAHPAVLQRLIDTNRERLPGYGADAYCARAAEKIREACACDKADVSFLTGGTQANAVVLSALLHSYEGVVSAETGHINGHEAGAIEYTGHKILALPQQAGKFSPEALERFVAGFYADENHAHMVHPGAVYLSYPTEYGTLYTKRELEAIAATCRRYGMRLFLDGARLGYGLASVEADVTLPDLARLADAFTIGGTKMGTLCGEAVVFPSGAPSHFLTTVKQHGALLAKGRLLGLQFDTLFTDDLYFRISKHAINMAMQIRDAFDARGLQFYLHSPTNLQFLIMENKAVRALQQKIAFHTWGKVDEEHSVARFATSWSTTQEDVDALIDAIKTL